MSITKLLKHYIRELKTKIIASKSHIMPGGNRHIVERHILNEMGIRAQTGIFEKAFYKNKRSYNSRSDSVPQSNSHKGIRMEDQTTPAIQKNRNHPWIEK